VGLEGGEKSQKNLKKLGGGPGKKARRRLKKRRGRGKNTQFQKKKGTAIQCEKEKKGRGERGTRSALGGEYKKGSLFEEKKRRGKRILLKHEEARGGHPSTGQTLAYCQTTGGDKKTTKGGDMLEL